MSFKSRLNQLQQRIMGKPLHRGTRNFAAEDAKRQEMAERLLELTPEDMREAVAAALVEREEAGFSTRRADRLHGWICDLGFDRTRLPEDLAPETMRKLLTVYLEDTPRECIGEVCDQCGLYRPHRGGAFQNNVWAPASDYFDSCPHCGCPEWTWSSQVGTWGARVTEAVESRKLRPARPAAGGPAEAEGEPHPFLNVGSCSFPQSDLPTS